MATTIPQTTQTRVIHKDHSQFLVASEHIGLAKPNSRLDKIERSWLLKYLVEGRTVEFIQRQFKTKFKRDISYATVASYRKKYTPKISQIIADSEFLILNDGLARRTERVRRLMLLADAMEEHMFDEDGALIDPNPKLISEYRQMLTQIGQEVGDIPVHQTNINFISMSTDELKSYIAGKLAANKDMAVMLAESAGIRPSDVPMLPAGEIIDGTTTR